MSESAKQPLVIFTYVVLTLSTLLVFWQVRNFDFLTYDDQAYVYENVHVLSGLSRDGVIWAFTTGHASNWHPLTWLSHMLDFQLFGLEPGWMHLVNLLLHLANALLLLTVLRRMTGSLWPSAFVAAAFAIHPMHIESVAWIAERKDVLSTFFLLLTLAAYIGYTERRTVFRYLATLVLFALGLLTKPMLVTLPFLLLLLDYWPLNRLDAQPAEPASRKERQPGRVRSRYAIPYGIFAEKIPFFVLAAGSSTITFLVQRAGGAVADGTFLPVYNRVANAFLSYARYIGRMFWPRDMAVIYPLARGRVAVGQAVVCLVLVLVISILAIWFGRKRKYLPVGWFWFVGTLVPVIGFVQVGMQAMADRYTYLPYIGLFVMIAWGLPELLAKWPHRKVLLGLSMALVLAALAICSHRQVGYWRNSVALFTHAIEVTRDNDIAYSNRAAAYNKLGRWQEAIDDYSRAIKIMPHEAKTHYDLGVAYGELGRWQEAVAAYAQAISIQPDDAQALSNLGVAYGQAGRWQEAIDAYKQALRIQPDLVGIHYNLGIAYGRSGRWQEAADTFMQAIRLAPNDAATYHNLALVYIQLGRRQEAIEAFAHALDVHPDSAQTHHSLANELAAQGRYDEALDHYRTALRLKPDWPVCMNNLALLIATSPGIKDRDTNEAIRLATRACELVDHKAPAFLGTLAAAYASAGRFSEAVDTANRALSLADAANQPQLKAAIQHHLSFYKQGKPYIEPDRANPSDANKP